MFGVAWRGCAAGEIVGLPRFERVKVFALPALGALGLAARGLRPRRVHTKAAFAADAIDRNNPAIFEGAEREDESTEVGAVAHDHDESLGAIIAAMRRGTAIGGSVPDGDKESGFGWREFRHPQPGADRERGEGAVFRVVGFGHELSVLGQHIAESMDGVGNIRLQRGRGHCVRSVQASCQPTSKSARLVSAVASAAQSSG